MKKLIAILMVLVVVAGFAFAGTETHQLRIKSVVDEKLPAFLLQYGSSYDGTAVHTNDGRTVFTASATYPATTDPATAPTVANEDEVFDLSVIPAGNDGKYPVTFVAVLVKNSDDYYAKTTRTFTLTFSEGDFLNVTAQKVAYTVGKTISVTPATKANDLTGIASIAAGTADNSVDVVFNGETVNADNVVVASATYTYTPNKNIDKGTYYADVKLTITTD